MVVSGCLISHEMSLDKNQNKGRRASLQVGLSLQITTRRMIHLVIPNIVPTMIMRMAMAPIRATDMKIIIPVFILILSRRTCRLSFSSMQYRFLFFLSMIVAN